MDKIGQFLQNFQQNPNQVSGSEVAGQFGNVTRQLAPAEYQQVAQQVLSQLSPQQRQELGKQLLEQAQQQGVSFPDVNRDGVDDRLQDPALLAGYTAQLQQAQPNFFNQLLGSAGSSPLMKLALGGIAALGLGRMVSGSGHHGGGGGHHGGGGLGSLFGGGHHGGGHH